VKSKVRKVNSESEEIDYAFSCLLNMVVFEDECEVVAEYGTPIACGDWQPQRVCRYRLNDCSIVTVTGHVKPHGEFSFRVLHLGISSHGNCQLMAAVIMNPHDATSRCQCTKEWTDLERKNEFSGK
jgi:hypothetical protein